VDARDSLSAEFLVLDDIASTLLLLRQMAESEGFDLPAFCKLLTALSLRLKSGNDKEFRRLVDVLFLHDFIPFRDAL